MKNKKFYAVLIAVVLFLVFKICAILSDEGLKDFFNILAFNPGLIIAFAILTNKEQNKKK